MIDPVLVLHSMEQDNKWQATVECCKERLEQSAQIVADLKQQVATLKRTNAVLHQSEALFRTTFEQAAVGIAHVAPNGRWLRVNQHLCHILGYTTGELSTLNFQALTHPADLMVDLQSVTQLLAGEIQTYTIHKRYLHKQGHTIWANLSVSLVRDESGAPAYFVSVVEDITQLKQAEQALQQSEERYRRVVEDQLDLICRFDLDFRLTFVNFPYSKAFGKAPDDLIGENMLNVIPLEYQPQVIGHLATLNAECRVGTCDNPVRMADGTVRWFQWTDQVIVDRTGRVVEYQSVGRDITERRQVEDAEREQRHYAEALRDSLAMLTSSLDIKKVLQQILISAATVVPSEAGSIILFEDTYGHAAYLRGFAPEAESFLATYRFPLDLPIFQQVLTQSQPYFIPDTRAIPDWVALPLTAWIRSSIGIPIELRGKVIGLLVADSATSERFKPTDIEKLQAFARYASLALENADHVTKLEQRVAERTTELRYYATEVEDLYNNAPCGYHSLDEAGYFVQINNTELHWLGYRREEVVGCLKLTDLLTPASKEKFWATFPRFKAQGWVKDIEYDLVRKDGSTMTVLLSATALYDERGQFLTSRTTLYDIRERKQAQQIIYESERKFRLLVEVAPLAILISDQNGQIALVNEQAEQLFGYARGEMLGQSVDCLVPAYARFAHPHHRAQYVTTPGVRRMANGRELFAVRKDGSEFPVEIQLSFAEQQTGCFIMDITERKQAAAALREQHDFLQLVIDSVPDLILVKDRTGCFQLVNERTAQIYGVTPADLVGQRDIDVHDDPAAVLRFHQQDLATLECREPLFIPETLIDQRCYQANLIPLKDRNGHYDRVLMVASDITTRKQAEEVLQQALETEKGLSELKSRFVSMASHEFRTPLTTIFSLTETLLAYRHKLTDDQIVQRLTKIQDQVGYLNAIIEDVLQLARAQSQRMEFKPTFVDLDALCRRMIDEFQSQPAVAARLTYLCATTPPKIQLDQRLMRQLMNNLVSNALKYSAPPQPVVVKLAYANETCVLQVCDQGMGIPEADLKHLFEPFHRAANVGAIAGTGLGLVIAKQAVELHDGSITVESQLGVGTTFTVTIPAVQRHYSGSILG